MLASLIRWLLALLIGFTAAGCVGRSLGRCSVAAAVEHEAEHTPDHRNAEELTASLTLRCETPPIAAEDHPP